MGKDCLENILKYIGGTVELNRIYELIYYKTHEIQDYI